MKGNTANAAILVLVIALVAGVAWYRSIRPAGSAIPETPSQKGDVCPEPAPTASADARPTSMPASAATTGKKLPRVVDLGADKCKACKDLAPILAALKKEYEGRVIVEFIDVWKDPKAGEPYKISVIPTQVFYDRDGNEVWRHVGFLPKEDFVKKFAELGVK